ncbi:MAG: DUF2147 domain-containing protein [Arcicella sp.]|nr:DUF2147 domain-containing protein [Arcicella sp.]
MKIFKCFLFLSFLFTIFSFKNHPISSIKLNADEAEKIVGVWFTDDKTSKIQIYKIDNQYFGKIIWLSSKENQKDLKINPKVGYQIFRKFTFEGENVWSGGQVSDPRSGLTVSGKMTLKNENTLNVRGYLGTPAFGKTVILQRVE